MRLLFIEHSIRPQVLEQQHKKQRTKKNFIDLELNLRCMLSAYHLGMGGLDIMKHLLMIGCDIYHDYRRNFSRNRKKVNEQIINTCNIIIDKQMVTEVAMTLKPKV